MPKIFLLVLLLIQLNAFSQETAIYFEPERHYKTGLDLFDKQKFGAAQMEFNKVLSSKENVSYTTRGNAAYFVGKCASELFNRDAEYLLLHFIDQYPANPYYQSAVYELGNYYYRLKRYKNAIEWLAKVDPADFDTDKK